MKLRETAFFFRIAVIAAVAIPSVPAAHAESDSWQAGVASMKITPDGLAWMEGYAARTEPTSEVEQDLFAKTLLVRDTAGETLVIVTLDLLTVPGPLRKHVEQSLAKSRNLKPRNLLLNCSHTHCGPEVLTNESALEGLDPDRRARAIAYVEFLQQRILSCIDDAFQSLAPATLCFQKARAGFAMNRRLPAANGFINSPNPNGPVDHDVPVLRVESPKGGLRAVLFGYACHATTLGFQKLCGDYPGYAQEYIEDAHPGAIALFMQGCGGDQNPYPRRTLDLCKQHGRTLATAVEAALSTPRREITGSLRIGWDIVDLKYSDPPSKKELAELARSPDKYARAYADRRLRQIEAGTLISSYPAPMQVIRFGNAVLFVAVSGEPVVDYSLRIKRENRIEGGPDVWVAGYCNDMFGYIPSVRVLLEGGYEGGLALQYVTTVIHPAPFAPNVEDRIMEQIDQLIQETAENPAK